MKATTPTSRLAAIVAAIAAALAVAGPARPYGWPVEPFHHQHPIRSYLGDPRVGSNALEPQFLHFGVDIAAPNNAPVYATISGRIAVHPLHPDTVVMVTNGSLTLEYWHIHPAVTSGHAVAYKTVLGHIISPCMHVHLTERHGSTIVNPLRTGGLEPYRDTTKPTIDGLVVTRGSGRYTLGVRTHDTPTLPVPKPWNDRPLVPALLRWRIRGLTAWQTAVDFRGVLSQPPISSVFMLSTRQNTVRTHGHYDFVLLRDWRPTHAAYLVDVRVADTSGNSACRSLVLSLAP